MLNLVLGRGRGRGLGLGLGEAFGRVSCVHYGGARGAPSGGWGNPMGDELAGAGLGAGEARNVSRRSVLRTAAHAAWVVPMIQVVAAAPAFAASGTLSIAGGSGFWNGASNNLTLTVDVTAAPATTGLQVTFTLPPEYGDTPDVVVTPAAQAAPSTTVSSGKFRAIVRPATPTAITAVATDTDGRVSNPFLVVPITLLS